MAFGLVDPMPYLGCANTEFKSDPMRVSVNVQVPYRGCARLVAKTEFKSDPMVSFLGCAHYIGDLVCISVNVQVPSL